MITTRLRYRVWGIIRLTASRMICFDLKIGDSGPGHWCLSEAEFEAFTLDLGLSPTTPAATEYTNREPPLYHGNRWP